MRIRLVMVVVFATLYGQLSATAVRALIATAAQSAESVPAPLVRFDVASVKPGPPMTSAGLVVRAGSAQPGGRWISQNARFIDIVRSVYREYPLRGQIAGGPAWVNTARFDINAKAEGEPSGDQVLEMMKELLAERFQLKVRRERRELDVYTLVRAYTDGRLGPGLRPMTVDCDAVAAARARGESPPVRPGARPQCSASVTESNGSLRLLAGAVPVSTLVTMIQGTVRQPIVDRTGLTNTFDIDLDWATESALRATPDATADDTAASILFAALQQQLGLKLELRKELMDVLVIDHVERPTPD